MESYLWPELHQRITTSLARFREQKNSRCPDMTPTDRFMCISCLSSIIRSKKGAYTEQERQDWLRVILVCIYENDDFFPKYFDLNGDPPLLWSGQAMHEYFDQYFNYQRAQYSGLYPYLSCAKSCYHSSNSTSCQRQNNEFIAAVLKEFQLKLRQRVIDLGRKEEAEQLYEDFFAVFQQDTHWFSNPVLFLFLPYFLFLSLAKCEGFFPQEAQEITPFSVINLDDKSMCWFIRGTYLNIQNQSDYLRSLELYELITDILYNQVRRFHIHTIGLALQQAEIVYRVYKESLNVCQTKKSVSSAFCFTVPVWCFEMWERQLFPLTSKLNNSVFSQQMNHIFSLLYRIPSLQIKQSLLNINDSYFKDQQILIKAETRDVPFWDLLLSIGIVHSPFYFQSDNPFDSPELQNAIDILYDVFLYPEKKIKGDQIPIEARWLMVVDLQYNLLFSPSRIDASEALFYSLLDQSVAHNLLKIKSHRDDSPLFDLARSFPIFQELQCELQDDRIIDHICFSDVSFWTGIQTRPYRHQLSEALKRCNTEYPLPKGQQTKHNHLWERIEHKTSAVPKLLFLCRSITKVDAAINISDSGDSLQISVKDPYSLALQKKEVLNHLRQIYGKIGAAIESLDDVRYLMLWYKIVKALRTNLADQIIDLSLRFLPFETN